MGIRMTASLVAAAAILIYFAWTYNQLVVLRNRVRTAWAQVDVQLCRRGDLIPNMVECVKGYIKHESSALTTIIETRRQAVAAGSSIAARAMAETALGESLHLLLTAAEAVPQLRASNNMLELQEELRTTENRIAFARQHYNDSVMEYNAAVASLPTNLVARLFAFKPTMMFSAPNVDANDVLLGELSAM